MMRVERARRASGTIEPLVNILETEKEIVLEAEMVGLSKKDVELELKGNELTITGKARASVEDVPKGYDILHRERCPLEYERTFVLGEEIDTESIEAAYEGGILKVTLPKSEKARPRRVEIS